MAKTKAELQAELDRVNDEMEGLINTVRRINPNYGDDGAPIEDLKAAYDDKTTIDQLSDLINQQQMFIDKIQDDMRAAGITEDAGPAPVAVAGAGNAGVMESAGKPSGLRTERASSARRLERSTNIFLGALNVYCMDLRVALSEDDPLPTQMDQFAIDLRNTVNLILYPPVEDPEYPPPGEPTEAMGT